MLSFMARYDSALIFVTSTLLVLLVSSICIIEAFPTEGLPNQDNVVTTVRHDTIAISGVNNEKKDDTSESSEEKKTTRTKRSEYLDDKENLLDENEEEDDVKRDSRHIIRAKDTKQKDKMHNDDNSSDSSSSSSSEENNDKDNYDGNDYKKSKKQFVKSKKNNDDNNNDKDDCKDDNDDDDSSSSSSSEEDNGKRGKRSAKIQDDTSESNSSEKKNQPKIRFIRDIKDNNSSDESSSEKPKLIRIPLTRISREIQDTVLSKKENDFTDQYFQFFISSHEQGKRLKDHLVKPIINAPEDINVKKLSKSDSFEERDKPASRFVRAIEDTSARKLPVDDRNSRFTRAVEETANTSSQSLEERNQLHKRIIRSKNDKKKKSKEGKRKRYCMHKTTTLKTNILNQPSAEHLTV